MIPTNYYQVLAFTIPAGSSVTLPHTINTNGVPVIPDMLYRDNMQVGVGAVTTDSVEMINPSAAGAVTCNVLLQQFASNERGFPGALQTLTPRPFIVGGADSCYCQPIS